MIFILDPEVKLGDILTFGSVTLALAGFLYGLTKDRRLRSREYADRIRLSAARTLAGINRWKEVALQSFGDVQPLLTDADTLIIKDQNYIAARDSLWRALMALQTEVSKRILAEKLEGEYCGLYGYAPDVHNVYSTATHELRSALDTAFGALLLATQSDVLNMAHEKKPYTSAILGNKLRRTAHGVLTRFTSDAEKAIRPLRDRMMAIVTASDRDIVRKRVRCDIPTHP